MTWRPHWYHHAESIAKENGWTVLEIEGGRMVFSTENRGVEVAVNLDRANELASQADQSAMDQIAVAALVLKDRLAGQAKSG